MLKTAHRSIRTFGIAFFSMLIILSFLFSLSKAQASLKIPDHTTVIEDEAFMNDASLDIIVLPEGIQRIGNRAFANSSAKEIYLPDSISSIGQDAFADCPALTCTGIRRSYAEEYCNANNIPFTPITTDISCFEYEAINGLKARITKYTGEDSIVVIPDEIDDYRITEIATGVFEKNETIQRIYLPFYLEKISFAQFRNCPNLISVSMNNKMATIEDYAFSNCQKLTAISWSEQLTTIGRGAFYGCTALVEADLPDSVETIGSNAFGDCSSLTSFHYPVSWNSLPQPAYEYQRGFLFDGCSQLTTITIPEGVQSIPDYAFARCGQIRKIVIPDSVTAIGGHAFTETIDISEFSFPQSIQTIGEMAFRKCDWLENLDGLSNTSLMEIGRGAFAECSNLVSANLPDTVQIISTDAFNSCINLAEFHYPVSWQSVPKVAYEYQRGFIFTGCKKLKTVTVPYGITTIPDYAFARCDYLMYVNLPDSVETIGAHAFAETAAIKNFSFPKSLQTIGEMAFGQCEWLENLDSLSDTPLKTVGRSAFYQCTGLTTANLPDSVEVIETNAFNGCTSLISFHYPLSWKSVPKVAWEYQRGFIFEGCKKLKSIDVPNGVITIPDYAFARCDYLQTVNIPASVVNIGHSAFKEDDALTYAYLSEYVEWIGDNAFMNDQNLTVECEWGTYALGYLRENNISYYYLSATGQGELHGASWPENDIIKGDAYSYNGFVRSSEEIRIVRGTITKVDGTPVIDLEQSPLITDYSLSGQFSYVLSPSKLEVGEYNFRLYAETNTGNEALINTRFTVVPQPLRTNLNRLTLPVGIIDRSYTLNGAIESNYPITAISFILRDLNAEYNVQERTFSPGTKTFDLANCGIDFSNVRILMKSSRLRIVLTSNNETQTMDSEFMLVEDGSDLDEDKVQAVIAFVTREDRDNSTRFNPAISYANSVISSYGLKEAVQIGFSKYWDLAMDKLHSLGSKYDKTLVDEYTAEIISVLNSITQSKVEVLQIDKSALHERIAEDLISLGSTSVGLVLSDDDLYPSDLKAFYTSIKDHLKVYKTSVKQVDNWNMLAGMLGDMLTDYSADTAILNYVLTTLDPGDTNYAHAMHTVKANYQQFGGGEILTLMDKIEELYEEKILEDNIKLLFKEFAGSSGAWTLARYTLKMFDKLSGNQEKAEAMWSFMMRRDNASKAVQAYKEAFDIVRSGNVTAEDCNRLIACFTFAQQSCKRMMDAEPVDWNKTEEQREAWSLAYTNIMLTKIDGVTEYPS